MGRARRRPRRRAARGRDRRPRLLPPPSRARAPLPPARALEARGARRDRVQRHGPRRLEPALRRADLGDPGRGAGLPGAGAARRRPLAPARSRPRGPPGHGRRRHGGARTGPAHPRLRLQHAASGQGDHRPPARLPELGGRPQPLERGVGRVRPGAGRGGPEPLRAGPPLVPREGAPPRHRQARRLRPDGQRLHRRRRDPVGPGPGHRPRRVRLVLRPGRRGLRPFHRRSAGSTSRRATASAAAPSPRPRCPRSTPT